MVYATAHINSRADCKNCTCTYFKCKGDKAGDCYCTCGHSCRAHVFPSSYVQEYKKLYDKAIAGAEESERLAEKSSSSATKESFYMTAREYRKKAREYLEILNKIK